MRYELRDDRRKEIVRSSSHIDAVKRDIMRTMSSTHFSVLPRLGKTPANSVTEDVKNEELPSTQQIFEYVNERFIHF
ncbi:unnamed protein product [Anisakis simplex]|uniref:Uncharacterized protein n=1 Tax=Anisakis simplex TaxID=6269 RepID=A0A3P6SKH0_ANISI|nr:unnamed protein product [Anisakis simplex]